MTPGLLSSLLSPFNVHLISANQLSLDIPKLSTPKPSPCSSLCLGVLVPSCSAHSSWHGFLPSAHQVWPLLEAGSPRCSLLHVPGPQVLVHSRSAGWQPLDLGLAAGYPPLSVRLEALASHDCPPPPQGNCYVWNLTGGIGDEVTQLIPKTKIPAHTRYALQCRFSPDSTCVQGWGAGGGVPGAGGLMRWGLLGGQHGCAGWERLLEL